MNRYTLTRTLIGLGIITIGILALLGGLNLMDFKELWVQWWPVLIIGVGLLMLINNPRQFIWPVVVILAGTLLQLRQFDLVTFNVWQLFWPIVLILIGLSVLLNRVHSRKNTSNKDIEEVNALFSGNEINSRSQNYKGGRATAIFGGITIDLREAKITGEANLNVFAFCGGIDIKVPENWVVKSRISPVLGGVENKANGSSAAKDAPILLITGDIVMGGVNIKNA